MTLKDDVSIASTASSSSCSSDEHNPGQGKTCSRLILCIISTIVTVSSHFRNNDNDSDDLQAPPTSNLAGDVGAEDDDGTEDDGAAEAGGTTPIDIETLPPHDLALLNTVSSTRLELFETVTYEPNVESPEGVVGGPIIARDPSSISGLSKHISEKSEDKTAESQNPPATILAEDHHTKELHASSKVNFDDLTELELEEIHKQLTEEYKQLLVNEAEEDAETERLIAAYTGLKEKFDEVNEDVLEAKNLQEGVVGGIAGDPSSISGLHKDTSEKSEDTTAESQKTPATIYTKDHHTHELQPSSKVDVDDLNELLEIYKQFTAEYKQVLVIQAEDDAEDHHTRELHASLKVDFDNFTELIKEAINKQLTAEYKQLLVIETEIDAKTERLKTMLKTVYAGLKEKWDVLEAKDVKVRNTSNATSSEYAKVTLSGATMSEEKDH